MRNARTLMTSLAALAYIIVPARHHEALTLTDRRVTTATIRSLATP
jgi:hypothetical protein